MLTSSCLLEEIEADKIVIIRVFDNNNPVYGEKYKFFTVGAITDKHVHIIGLYEPNIALRDVKTFLAKLKETYGVTTYSWEHKGKKIYGTL